MLNNKKEIGIALFGFGTVGQGVAEIFQLKKEKIENICRKKLQITGVAVRNMGKKRTISLPQNIFTTDIATLIAQENVDIVFELMGGIKEAKRCVLQALQAGKPVITANKALLAEHGKEIFTCARENGLPLGFEASVAAGLPIINILRNDLASTQIIELQGIINGTTNFILSQMQEKEQSYDEAFALARSLGYLEADPKLDVDGWDAAHKLVILASIVFQKYFSVDDVDREGISGITAEKMRAARAAGQVIKLIASARAEKGEIKLAVCPQSLPENHRLATVDGGMSAVWLRGDLIGESFFIGPGAGALPTASAVVSDLIAMLRDPQIAGYGF